MSFSRLERITIIFTLLLIAFLSGWFLCRQHGAAMVFTPAVSESAAPSGTPSMTPDATLSPAPAAARVNINTADKLTLCTLPGIGEKRACDIIAYREAHGSFLIPEAITDVPGIGPAILEEIIDLITVEDEL